MIMETVGSSETSVHLYQTTQRHIQKYGSFHSHRRKNDKSNLTQHVITEAYRGMEAKRCAVDGDG